MKHRLKRDGGGVPRDRQFRCEQLPGLADRLTVAINRLTKWNVRIAEAGRLRAAERLLRKTATAGTYPFEPRSLHRIAEAIRLAQDFGQIMDALGAERSERLAAELQRAMKGTLDTSETEREPYQFHTQFWFGAILSRGHLDPCVPSDQERNPDFLVRPGTVQYGVEIKRPSTQRGAFDGIKTARDQLRRSSTHGIVVVDITDCLDQQKVRSIVPDRIGRAHEAIRSDVEALRDALGDLVWNSERREHRPGFELIMGLWIIARGWRWILNDLSTPEFFEAQGMYRFSSTKGNMWHHRAEEFFELVSDGLSSGGFFLHELTQESDEPITRPFWEDWTGKSTRHAGWDTDHFSNPQDASEA